MNKIKNMVKNTNNEDSEDDVVTIASNPKTAPDGFLEDSKKGDTFWEDFINFLKEYDKQNQRV